jgi:ketosteroid isomerase-like protein
MNLPGHLLVVALATAPIAAATAKHADPQSELRAVDEAERAAIAANDVAAMAALAHPNLIINGPNGSVIDRTELLRRLQTRDLDHASFTRTIEEVRMTGNLGVVMGHEAVVERATSRGGNLYGTSPLERRYTDVFLREDGRWRLIARHSNVTPASVRASRLSPVPKR